MCKSRDEFITFGSSFRYLQDSPKSTTIPISIALESSLEPICNSGRHSQGTIHSSDTSPFQTGKLNVLANACKSRQFCRATEARKIHNHTRKTGELDEPEDDHSHKKNEAELRVSSLSNQNRRLLAQIAKLEAELAKWKMNPAVIQKETGDLNITLPESELPKQTLVTPCTSLDGMHDSCSMSPPCLNRVSFLIPKEADRSMTDLIESHGG
jgi:hypothetical protein